MQSQALYALRLRWTVGTTLSPIFEDVGTGEASLRHCLQCLALLTFDKVIESLLGERWAVGFKICLQVVCEPER